MTEPNRIERVWPQIKADLLAKWNQLTEEDLSACDFQYDLVVESIRRVYYPGRSQLTLEGDVRDWLNERITVYEKQQEEIYFGGLR